MKIKVTPKEKKLIDGLHILDNKGAFYFSQEEYFDYATLRLHFLYYIDNQLQNIIIDFSDTFLSFADRTNDIMYKYEDFTEEDI